MLKKVRPCSTRFLTVLASFRVDLTTFAKQWKKWNFAFVPSLVMKTFFFRFFFLLFAFIGVVNKRLSTNQNVKSIEVIF